MSYLSFDKKRLVNLEYSLKREILRTNRAGSFALTTIVFCNTRKYHGLLICPIPAFGDKRHVLLSSLDESLYGKDEIYNLGTHCYKNNVYSPKGYKYAEDFHIDNVVRLTFRVGGAKFTKEYVMIDQSDQIIIKYTLEDCEFPLKIRFRPYTAFRSIHALSKANEDVRLDFEEIKNGIKYCMYNGFPDLHFQFSKEATYVHNPLWHYNIAYEKERDRGYDFMEDLMVPGYFELEMKKGESLYFSASTELENSSRLKSKYINQVDKRVERNNLIDCLVNSGNQFFVKKGKKNVFLYSGYPWHGIRGRSTFIALNGLMYSTKVENRFEQVVNSMLLYFKDGMFPNLIVGEKACYHSCDVALWFIRALQISLQDEPKADLWKKYGKYVKDILNSFEDGMPFNIRMHDNMLIYAGDEGVALTWMDSVVDGVPVTPRVGYQVEVNALWYNAICFALELAKASGDIPFENKWKDRPEIIASSFIDGFWNEQRGYCADYFTEYEQNWEVRPNMVIAASLIYSPLSKEMKKAILDVAQKELLTSKGLRTLSPNSSNYKGLYRGVTSVRQESAHQGSVWPWLLEPYYEAYLSVHGDDKQEYANELLKSFEEDVNEHGVGSISEIYEGNPPHDATGAISFACSVAALLRINNMHSKKKKK